MTATIQRPRISAHSVNHDRIAADVLDHCRMIPGERRLTVSLVTKYLSPTNTLGSRFKAIDQRTGKSAIVHANYNLNSDENHCAACIKYLQSIAQGQQFELISYQHHYSGTGYTFVFEWL